MAALSVGCIGFLTAEPAIGAEPAPPPSPAERQAPGATDDDSGETSDQNNWSLSLGAGGLIAPDYPGSDNYEPLPLPHIEASYRDILFLSGPSLGANLVALSPWSDEGIEAGPILRFEFARDEDDNEALDRLGDVDWSLEAGGFLRYGIGGWSAELTLVTDVADGHEGTVAEVATGFQFPLSARLFAGLKASASWVDDDYMQAYFGITPAQAARSGRQQYDAGGGLKDVGVTLMLHHILTPQWSVAGLAGYTRLLGDAADSPLVKDEGSADQFMGGLLIGYRF